MKTIQLYIGTFLILLSITSCGEDFFTTTLDIDAPTPEDILVTHAYLNIDNGKFSVWASDTESILNNSFNRQQLESANVVLSDDLNNSYSVDIEDNDVYDYQITDIDANANEVKISVSAPGFESNADAVQIVPSKTIFKSFEFFEDGGLNTEGERRSAIEVVFDDPPGEENFYEVFILIRNPGDIDLENLRPTYTNSNDPIVNKGHDYYSIIFDDTSFDGQEKIMNLSVYQILEERAKDNVFITWKNVSKDYYRFSKTYKAFRDQEDNPFATPVQIFSNFENGHGIFSVFREQFISVF